MKRKLVSLILALVLLTLLVPTVGFAGEAIPARYLPILEDWGATTAEELYQSILDHWKSISPDQAERYIPKYYPLTIRFGGTTKELLADRENWNLAIVSSKDIDLEELIAQGVVGSDPVKEGEEYPWEYSPVLYQWLLPEAFSYLRDPARTVDVFVYDYDAEKDDATLLLCKPNEYRDNSPAPRSFAAAIMYKRPAEIARALQGIRWIPEYEEWSEEDYLTHSDEWDMGILYVKRGQLPTLLDEAGLLYDFSKNEYFASRDPMQVPDYIIPEPIGIYNAEQQMIGVPCELIHTTGIRPAFDTMGVLIVNAKSPNLNRAISFAEHYMFAQEGWERLYLADQ